jgi:hypothetical protein
MAEVEQRPRIDPKELSERVTEIQEFENSSVDSIKIDKIEFSFDWVVVGERKYRLIHTSRCYCCNSKWFVPIHYLIIAHQLSYVDIAEIIHSLDPKSKCTADNIAEHRKRHLPDAIAREIADDVARQTGLANKQGGILTPVSFFMMIMQRTQEKIAKGELDVEVNQGLRAGHELFAIQQASGSDAEAADAISAMEVWMSVLVDLLDPAILAEFSRRVDANPIIRSIKDKYKPSQTPQGEKEYWEADEYIDAEVVEHEDEVSQPPQALGPGGEKPRMKLTDQGLQPWEDGEGSKEA